MGDTETLFCGGSSREMGVGGRGRNMVKGCLKGGGLKGQCHEIFDFKVFL
jgi:hypothetical protein